MKQSEIQGMVKALRPVLKNREQARQRLEKYWSGKIALVWTVADIHKAANERGVALTEREAQHLLDDLRTHYNPQHGIKWVDLWDLVESSGYGRRMTSREVSSFVEKSKKIVVKQHN